MPNHTTIRNRTAEIRHGWTVGERHHRARLAMLLQERLLSDVSCGAPEAKAS
jgi:hypothetical protein